MKTAALDFWARDKTGGSQPFYSDAIKKLFPKFAKDQIQITLNSEYAQLDAKPKP